MVGDVAQRDAPLDVAEGGGERVVARARGVVELNPRATKQASISTPPSMGHVPRTVTLEYSSAGGISGSVRL